MDILVIVNHPGDNWLEDIQKYESLNVMITSGYGAEANLPAWRFGNSWPLTVVRKCIGVGWAAKTMEHIRNFFINKNTHNDWYDLTYQDLQYVLTYLDSQKIQELEDYIENLQLQEIPKSLKKSEPPKNPKVDPWKKFIEAAPYYDMWWYRDTDSILISVFHKEFQTISGVSMLSEREFRELLWKQGYEFNGTMKRALSVRPKPLSDFKN
jgi:hypothetical protein